MKPLLGTVAVVAVKSVETQHITNDPNHTHNVFFGTAFNS